MALTLEELRQRAAAWKPPAAADFPPLPTGNAALDALLGGGLPRGRIVEIAGAWSSGKTVLALTAAARATARGLLCAYVDARRELYPPSAAALGVDLERLLVVRPTAGGMARAGEIVARSQAFPLVLLDLPDGERLEAAAAGRLRAAASASGASVVALSTSVGAVAHAAVRLQVAARHVLLHGARVALVGDGKYLPDMEVPEMKVISR